MAHQSPIVPIRKQRNPVSWPRPEETASQVLPVEESAGEQTKDLYRTSTDAIARTLGDLQQKLFRTATSAVDTVRTFAHERPLHLIGIVAGASFVAGVALRIWRSKRYA